MVILSLTIIRNDITRMEVDAIVNASNPGLKAYAGGVNGSIHRAAGPELAAACRELGGCRPGEAKITKGFNLPCRYVIHTVGPVWVDGEHGEEETLAACYTSCLQLALENHIETIAFPLIASGTYRFPSELALKTATKTIGSFLDRLEDDQEMEVTLVVYSRNVFNIGQRLYRNIRSFISDNQIEPDDPRRRQGRFITSREEVLFEENLPNRPFHALHSLSQGIFPEEESTVQADYDVAASKMLHPAPPLLGMRPCETEADSSLDDYLKQVDEGFRDMLLRKIDESGMTDPECYKKANVDRKLFAKIKNQKGYKTSKNTVLAFAVALELPLNEIQEMLMKAGYSLSRSSIGDLIVMYFVSHGVYDVFEINSALFRFDQGLLGSKLEL